jgi:hypothetical protein
MGKALGILTNENTAVVAICLTWDCLQRHKTQSIVSSSVTKALMSLNRLTSIPSFPLAEHSDQRYWLQVNITTVMGESKKKRPDLLQIFVACSTY